MKQAILITAYKNPNQLLELVKNFSPEHFAIYVHWDKKTMRECSATFLHSLPQNVSFHSIYRVNWGGINHLKAILFLLREGLKAEENYFFHLITGEDLPLKSETYFMNTLDTSKSYLEFTGYPPSHLPASFQDNLDYYNFFDLFDAKKYLKVLRLLKNIQKKIRLKRSNEFSHNFLKYGSTYWSLKRLHAKYIHDYTKENPNFLNRLKFTFCPEEIYVPTLLANAPLDSDIENDNLRYIKWSRSGKSGSPDYLNQEDYIQLSKNNAYLFGRKFSTPLSQLLK